MTSDQRNTEEVMPRQGRVSREAAPSREDEVRKTTWAAASILPDPPYDPDWVYRWVRTSHGGEADNRNVSMKFREGWEAVRAEDHQDLMVQSDYDSRFTGMIEIGGLLLCKCPRAVMEDRARQYAIKNARQIQAVDENFMRESDPRMPLNQALNERSTRTTFGDGKI
jgi:hypothetical protein